MIFKNKQILKRAIMLLIMLAPILCMGDYVPGIVLARLKRGVVELPQGQTEGNIESIKGNDNLKTCLQNAGLTKIEKLFPKFNSADTMTQLKDGETVHVQDLSLVFKLSFDPDVDIETITDSLEQYTDVIYAEPDHIMELSSFPNDPRFGEQWALKQNSDCDIDADSAWGIETGNINIKIGIVDNGIEWDHIDLGDGFGLGYKIRGGWDYTANDSYPEPYHNKATHGTKVSGIASALTHNGYGIAGLTGGDGNDIGCQLYMFKVGITNSIITSYAVQAIQEAASPGGYDIDVINCSFGGSEHEEVFREAISYAYKCRKTIVFSKGNAGSSAPHYPSDYDGHWLISVGATDQYDIRWEYSNYGNGIDVVAPGVDILTTTLIDSGYFKISTGTSFAAPHVTGLAALIRSMVWPTIFLYPEDVEGVIRATAYDPPWSDPGYDDLYGAGRINAYYALKYLGYRQALSRSAVTPADCIFTGYYQKTFIGVSGLDDGTYNVQRFGFYRDVWLPADTLKFHGIWGLGRTTDGYSDGDPNYGEGYCNVSEIPGLPGCYRVSSYIYKVWDLDWTFEGWFPIEPNHPTAPSNVFLAYTVFSTKFFPPHGPYADNITETSLTLHWSYYYPELIDCYTVKRDGQVIGNPPSNQLYWDDSGLEPGHLYHYEVLARKGSVYSSAVSLDVSTLPTGMLAGSECPTMSAFNNSAKVAMSGSNIYIVYVADQYWAPSGRPHIVYCLRSTDGGNSFVEDELGSYYYIADYPSIALDDDANPHVVWGAVTKITGNYYRKYFYSTFDGNNWTAPQPIYGNHLNITGELTEEHLCPPSFIIKGDSGFVAWQENYGHGGDYNGLNLTTFELSNPASTYATHGIKHGVCFMGLRAPCIGYDPGGRLVLVYATWWDQACAYGDINFIYREPNGIWSDPVLIGSDQAVAGIPSLCTRYGMVYIGFQHLLNNDSIAYATLSWLGGNYTAPAISFIAQLDPQGQVPFSAFPNLVNENLVTWQNNDGDIYYSQRAGATWTTPVNISDRPDEVSSYPQGVVFDGGSRRKLLALWTQQIGDDYYLVRDKIDLPSVCPYVDVALSDIPEATGYNNSRRLIRDSHETLHLCFTNDNEIYHTLLQDTTWSEPVLVGTGKYPSLSLGADGKIYCTYSFHGYRKFGGLMYYVEYLMTSTYDGEDWSNPSILFHTYGSFLWGVGAPSMVVSDTMAYVTFKSYHGPHPHPAPGTVPPHIIVVEGPALIYGKFPVNNASAFTYEIIDTIIKDQIEVDTLTYRNSLVPLLISPSLAVDLENVKHILWEGDSTQMRYYTIIDTSMTCEFFDSEVDYPWLTMNGDRIDLFWTTRDSIRYRYGWTGTPNLSSSQTVATCESPISSDQYLTWTKQSGDLSYLYCGAVPANDAIAPIEVDYSTNLISYPQILYNPKVSNEPASIDLVWTDYSCLDSLGYIYHLNLLIEEPAPTYAFDMGTETPVPVLVERDGYLILGPEDFQTFDYDSTELIYHMTLHSPRKKYKIRWIYYHEESNKLKLQFNIDDILHHNHWVDPGEIVTGDAWIPQACLTDNEITIKVKRLKGTIAVLSGIEIFVEEVGGGGPQSAGVQPIKRFFFESMYPNPTKGSLKIRFNSPDERIVTVKMYDVVGRLAETIFNGKAKIGMNEFLIMPKELSAGIYFVRLETSGYEKTEKIILLQ